MELDPSLIEIAGEDDSLLQQIPTLEAAATAAAANSTNYFFSRSPLQIRGSNCNADRARLSPIMGLKGIVDMEKPTCSSPVGSGNKENINANKSEVPKLSVEPQQMKRKKRGGANNLRKSLAWDRAFFTEEGVLNPLELSILCGSFGNSSREVLPTIEEEGRKVSCNSGSTSDSVDLQGTPKVLSNQKGSRSGTKRGGCPRPLVFSSLKRPANASTTKVAVKESKLPKIPVSRSGAHSLPKFNKSNVLSTSHSKHNQMGQADFFQKCTGLQGSSYKTESSVNKANSGSDSSAMTAKSSCQPPRRIMTNLALEVRSSTNPQPTLRRKAKSGLEVFPSAVVPPTGSHAPNSHDVSRKTGILLPQNTHNIVRNVQCAKFQTTKPSGLRMPSPSLGFFGQTKPSASNSSSQKATQRSNIPKSYIPSLQRLKTSNYSHDPRLLHAREKMPKKDNNATVSGMVSGSSTKGSVPCASNDVPHENRAMKLEGNDELIVEALTSCYHKRSELMEGNKEVQNIIAGNEGFKECGEPHKDYQCSSEDDSDFLMNDKNLPLQSRSSDPLQKDGINEVTIACSVYRDSKKNNTENNKFASQHSGAVQVKSVPITNDTINHQHVDDKQYSSAVGTHQVILESQSEYSPGDIKQDFVIVPCDNSSDISDSDEWSRKRAEPINASSGEADQLLHRENHCSWSDDILLLEQRKSFESQKYESESVENVHLNLRETKGSEKTSSSSSPRESARQANESCAGVDQFGDKLHVEAVQVRYLDITLSAKSSDNNLRTSEVQDQVLEINDNSKTSAEPPEPQSRCLLIEQASELNHGFLLGDYSMFSEGLLAAESQGVCGLEIALKDGNDYGTKLSCSNVLITQDPGAIQDDGVDVNEMVEQAQVKAALCSSAERLPPVENRKCHIDTPFGLDLSLKKNRDDMAGDATTCESMVFCSLSKEEDIGANGLKSHILAEKAENKVSTDNPHEDNERTKVNGGILFGGSRSLNEFHCGDLGNNVDDRLINQGSVGSEMERCQNASLFEYTEEDNEGAAGIGKMTNELCLGDAKVQSLDVNLLIGSSNGRLSNSAIDTRCLIVVTDVNGRSGGVSELQTPSIVVDNVFPDDGGLHLNDYLLPGKSTGSDEPQEEKVLANIPIVREQNDGEGSESKSSSIAIQVPPSMQDNGVDMEGMAEHRLAEDTPSSLVDKETSTEYDDEYSIETDLGNDMVFNGQATSSESDLPLMMKDDDQTVGEITPNRAFCLSEESGFSDQKIQKLANETNIVNLGDDQTNTILPVDIEVEISQTNVRLAGELQHELDNAICPIEDEDTTVPIKKSADGGEKNNLTIKPPINAVPFSDEWLAAMEAAGEDILTMKSGAVQNSPPDRSLPEPGPWSPVKRKHNEIGPFDCTKFINIPPPDSD